MYSKAILIAGLAATAAANLRPGDIVMKRDLYARQTAATGVYSDCLTALASIYSAVPTPPAELLSYEMTYTATDPCSYSIPKSLESVYSSYESEVESFYEAHSSEINSAVSECPQYSAYETDYDTVSDVCATGGSGSGSTGTQTAASASATTTESDSGSGSSGSSSSTSKSGSSSSATSTVSNNLGPRETGFAVAAVAAAGVLGVVVAL